MISAPEYLPLTQAAQTLAPPVDPHSEILIIVRFLEFPVASTIC